MAADNIKVAVRVRPLLSHELAAGHKTCVKTKSSEAQVYINGPNSKETYSYTYAFGSSHTDQDVYGTAVKPLVPPLFQGYNVTVLAYGQTGSGKTYSMGTSCGTDGGNPEGIIPKSVADIFNRIQSSKDDNFIVSVSFLELYNEQIRDLLQNVAQSSPTLAHLEVREDPALGVCIPGLSSIPVQSVEETLDCLAKASQFRSTGATAMNKVSSRSHAIFTLKIERLPRDGSQATIAKFCMVDLAGSERVKKTLSTGERFKEGVNINMGLLALGNVISALGDDVQRKGHIPYRDSKLTRLLQDSLGGNSYTLMIACVSPSELSASETLNTLRYADRALKIKNKPVVNADIKAAEIEVLKSQIHQMRLLLDLERNKSYKKCPPGHQRLIDIIKGELNLSECKILRNKIQATSPRTKNYLRQVGISCLESDEEEEVDLEVDDVCDDEISPKSRLFPALTELQSPNGHVEKETDYVTTEELHYHEHLKHLDFEMNNLDEEMKNKEAQVKELGTGSEEDVEEKLVQLQQQISDLLQEKHALEASLNELQQNKTKNQLAEQRRQQIKELERRIALQNKQLADLARLKTEKKRNTEKIGELNYEIQNLKQARVQLTREMKKSSENFRQWKHRQDREVGRLQEAERKGRFKLDLQAKTFAKQQNVLQRKYQEAMAHIKRLQAQRRPQGTIASQNAEKLEFWLEHELEVERSLAVTREALDHLIAERSRLTEKVHEIETSKCWEDRDTRKKRLNESRIIQSRIMLQDSQITDLEQKLIGFEMIDYNKSSHSRWVGVNNLGDARLLLNSLFTKLMHAETELSNRHERVVELEEAQINLNQQVKDLQNKLSTKDDQDMTFKLMPPPNSKFHTPERPSNEIRAPAVSSVLKNRKSLFINPAGLSDEETEFEDLEETFDSDKDPDWRLTPLIKRQRNSKENHKKRSGSNELTRKLSDGNRCACKGGCSNKRCACVKSSEGCSENCKCLIDQCRNRSNNCNNNSHETTFTIFNSTPADQTFTSSLKRESADSIELSEEEDVPKKKKFYDTNIQ